ncbi:MAG TPA: hypothetical protein VM100_08575, partial [Longimicrobiales bacterium]|nr:hypothetical protein [Longimicrobiales bacterium]
MPRTSERLSSIALPHRNWQICSLTLLLLFSLLLTSVVRAQCPTGPISYIFIDNHSIFDTADPSLNSKFGWAYRTANSLHVRTKRVVIERELLFNPGDCYDPFLLQETERLLRAYDFLAQVDVFGIPQPDGSYHVVVDTRDQWSTSLDLRIGFDRGFYIDGMRLRETNLLGRGQEIAFSYRNREVTRDYGVTFGTRQFGGTRWDLRTAFGKTRAGSFVDQTVTYPFVGEVGRYAARQSFTREDQFFDYIFDTPDQPSQHILVPVRQKTFDVGIGGRLGHRGNLTVIGAMLTYQELTFPGQPELADQGDFDERVPVDSALQ